MWSWKLHAILHLVLHFSIFLYVHGFKNGEVLGIDVANIYLFWHIRDNNVFIEFFNGLINLTRFETFCPLSERFQNLCREQVPGRASRVWCNHITAARQCLPAVRPTIKVMRKGKSCILRTMMMK